MSGKIVLGILLTFGLSWALLAQNAQELYQRGLVQEQAAGDLKQAIDLYRQSAKESGKDRRLAAKALLRAAGSQEKLGDAEATQSYTEVIRTYPEQREQVQMAQARLAELRRTSFPTQTSRTDVSSVVGPVFEQYCVACHSESVRQGGFALDSLNIRNVGENTAAWENVLHRLRARRDPPTGRARPDEATYQSVISKIELALDQAYPANGPLNSSDRATDAELAARMAKFIWGTAPDPQLLEDVQRGRLRDATVMDQEVRRMLRDPKSVNLTNTFFTKWLALEALEQVKPDSTLFPEFDQALRDSMANETRLFLNSQLREDHGALELWTANYTFVNERLAHHYGIPNVSGSEFRRVTWPDSNRAGLLGQASVLSVPWVASTRTSPTKRGVYLVDHFFGMDAPNPPPNVPPMADTAQDRTRSMRERVTAHKTNPACVSCHTLLDPMGLALENFDPIGQWRNNDGGIAIDASGAFIDGTRFNGPSEFRSGLLKYRDAYYSNITQQLLAYALGRAEPWRVYDYEQPSVRAIVRSAGSNDYRWSAIVLGIVKSAPFQMKNLVP